MDRDSPTGHKPKALHIPSAVGLPTCPARAMAGGLTGLGAASEDQWILDREKGKRNPNTYTEFVFMPDKKQNCPWWQVRT